MLVTDLTKTETQDGRGDILNLAMSLRDVIRIQLGLLPHAKSNCMIINKNICFLLFWKISTIFKKSKPGAILTKPS